MARFTVNEYSTGFEIEDKRTGLTHWLSDGVDCLFDEFGNALNPGRADFAEKWAESFNENEAETLEAYFPVNSLELRSADSPGKFEGELMIAAYLYERGYFDEETGDVQELGFYAIVRGPISADEHCIEAPAASGGEPLTAQEIDYLERFAGVIFRENSDGFVSADWHENSKELEARWSEIEADHASDDDDDDCPDDDNEALAASDDEPQELDLITKDYVSFFEFGMSKPPVVIVREGEDWGECVKAYQDKEKFWGSVWLEGERGGFDLLTFDEGDED